MAGSKTRFSTRMGDEPSSNGHALASPKNKKMGEDGRRKLPDEDACDEQQCVNPEGTGPAFLPDVLTVEAVDLYSTQTHEVNEVPLVLKLRFALISEVRYLCCVFLD